MVVLPDVWVGFLGAAWSLSTEWQFYLLALLIGPAWVCGRWPGCSWRSPWEQSPGMRRRRRVAVQPRVPAEQGAILRTRHHKRGRGAARQQGVRRVPCRVGRDTGAERDGGRHRQAVAAGALDAVSGRAARPNDMLRLPLHGSGAGGGARSWAGAGVPLPALVHWRPQPARGGENVCRQRSMPHSVCWPRYCNPARWSGWVPCRTASIWSTSRCRSCWAWRLRVVMEGRCRAVHRALDSRDRSFCRSWRHGGCTNGSRLPRCVGAVMRAAPCRPVPVSAG